MGRTDTLEFIDKVSTQYQASHNFCSKVFCPTRYHIMNLTADQIKTLSGQLNAQNLGVLIPIKGNDKMYLYLCGCPSCMNLVNGTNII